MDTLEWLERWYQDQCDGDWEHQHGVTIETLDNPGWLVRVEFRDMNPEALATDRALAVLGDPPTDTNGNEGGASWMTCDIKSGKFVGAGDPTQLRSILAQLRKFVETEGR